jgi:hypothetical protein
VTTEAFEHPALLYRGSADYLAATTMFVRNALEAGCPVLIAVPGQNLDLLRGALVDDGWRITFADMAVAGRNPGRILPPLPPVPEYAKERAFDAAAELPRVRSFVRQVAGSVLPVDRVDDVVMAANELVTNALRHTRGGGRIAVWPERHAGLPGRRLRTVARSARRPASAAARCRRRPGPHARQRPLRPGPRASRPGRNVGAPAPGDVAAPFAVPAGPPAPAYASMSSRVSEKAN